MGDVVTSLRRAKLEPKWLRDEDEERELADLQRLVSIEAALDENAFLKHQG